MKKLFCDDGSTAVKLAWFDDNGERHTLVSHNSFKEGWNTSGFGSDKTYNYLADGEKYAFDTHNPSAIVTTNIEYQYGVENRLSVHHALLQTGLEPQDVELWVTLPVSEYFTSDMQENTDNIQRKSANLQKDITLNKGQLFSIKKVHVLPESLPAALTSLEADNVRDLETSLVVDLGGTTLDCGAIAGRYRSVSQVSGEPGLGVTLVTTALMNALKQAGSHTSYYIADQLVKNRNTRELFETVVNDASKIDTVCSVIDSSIARLSERVIQHLQAYKGVNRIYLTGGGAELIYPAVKAAFPLLKEKVSILPDAQLALVTSIAEINR
ncbi:plasmid segregation protein ParM (plasmid) [Arsenophonus nasoniae]|uniref:Plasmid segregation protein ParM n=1 Tax=Arsenophonus nasoniae TaxID=638 RepID=A0A4P7L7J2_9GAMM|nr:plasmid segregation protein ParM domain-containing protein [Arsenophonus nasoniae]QBY46254.1 Plasmid segregation protein ParM [Arsenophonus nasoniae]WGM08167.1 plasmid segregation protein ParM [Arsenophonus nasoniae]WGM13016.1 plasmid segregation protein ParM [Arsenophonus nasoniae]WGM17746.1 plasmid segregation protein ParM [Arsenophonus nasoniae]